MKNLENNELIMLAKEGNSDAFDELANRYYKIIYEFAYKWCGVKEYATEITHDAIIKTFKNIKSFENRSTFKTWLYRVTINGAKDFFKINARKREKERKIEEIYSVRGGSEPETNHEKTNKKANEILEFMRTLPPKEKDAALLVFGEGKSHKEAAEILNCPESTISGRICKVKKKIRKRFPDDEVI